MRFADIDEAFGAGAFAPGALETGKVSESLTRPPPPTASLMDAENRRRLVGQGRLRPDAAGLDEQAACTMSAVQRLKDARQALRHFPVSERAWRERAGSECFVNIGDRMTAENLIQCIIVVSGNDSTIVVAEALGGTVEGSSR